MTFTAKFAVQILVHKSSLAHIVQHSFAQYPLPYALRFARSAVVQSNVLNKFSYPLKARVRGRLTAEAPIQRRRPNARVLRV